MCKSTVDTSTLQCRCNEGVNPAAFAGYVLADELTKPAKNTRYYHPLEQPTRYPLELTANHHICLWAQNGEYKWTIAYFAHDKEGVQLVFVGDRPLDKRVNWQHFEQCVRQGQKLADAKWDEDHQNT